MSPRPARKGPPATLPDDLVPAEDIAIKALLGSLEYVPGQIVRPLVDPEMLAEEALELGGSLRKYIPEAWRIVEPSKFVPNWHIDAISEHLEAVSNGDILDLLITVPPRHSKSLIISVLWPTWEWINRPYFRWMFASYGFNLSVRDSVKRRSLIKSQWYQSRFADKYAILPDQDTKAKYENDKHGYMMAGSVEGSNTGEGGERIVADDPHNIKKAESEDVRQATVDWWNIVMSTRRNDARSARVVVQQRVHEADVAGDIIDKGGYVHLNLPTEFGFAGGQRCRTGWTVRATGEARTWEDPRQEEGELLNPARFDAAANEAAKVTLGDYQYAAQHGQNPTPPKGQIVQAQWLKYYGGPGQPPIPDWTRSTHPMTPLFSLDCTFEEHKDTDFVAGTAWAMFGADAYLLPIVIHKRMSFSDTIDSVAEFVGGESLERDKQFPGIFPFIKMKLVENKANGPAVLSTLRHKIPGMVGIPANTSKQARFIACSWRFRAGNVYLPHESIAPWIKEYVYELCAFPKAKKDDYVDSTSQALNFIGGDIVLTGEPIMTGQESKWIGIGEADIQPGNGMWASFMGSSGKSVWRR